MGIFKQIGSMKNRLNPFKAAVNAAYKSADKIEQNIADAHMEMEKQIPAPKFEMHPDMLSDAEIDARLAELEKKATMSHDYTDMLNSQTIVKPKELEEVDYALRNRDSLRRPTDPLTEQRKKYEMEGSVPHGKCKPTDLVDIVTNVCSSVGNLLVPSFNCTCPYNSLLVDLLGPL